MRTTCESRKQRYEVVDESALCTQAKKSPQNLYGTYALDIMSMVLQPLGVTSDNQLLLDNKFFERLAVDAMKAITSQ